MTADLGASCKTLAGLIAAAEALMATRDIEDGTDAMPGLPATYSRPPWNPAAAEAVLDAHEGLRRLEASLRFMVTGHPGHRRGGTDANTTAALAAIEALGHAIAEDDAARAARYVDRWSRQVQELPAVDLSEPWRRIPAACPYCGFPMLRVAPRSGQVTCLRHGACYDTDHRHPIGRMDISRLTGDAVITWADGLVTP